MDILNSLFQFFTNSNHPISKKIKWALGITICIILFDCLFGISYQISVHNKIENISKIEEIKSKELPSSEVTYYLNELEKEIISNRDFYSKIKHLPFDIYSNILIPANTKIGSSKEEIKNHTLYNFLSSSIAPIIMLFIIIIIIFISIFKKDNIQPIRVAFVSLLMAATTILSAYLFGLFPLIGSGYGLNYILNIVLGIILFFLIANLLKKPSKKKKVVTSTVKPVS